MTTREVIGRAIPIVVLAACLAVLLWIYADHRNLPINALRAQSPIEFEYPAQPPEIIDAITAAYGVYVNWEYPNDPGGEGAYIPDMYPSAAVGDSLQTFFDSIEEESYGLLEGLQIGESLCIVPKKRSWTDHRSNLDRIIGVNIEDVNTAAALWTIAIAVNQYSVEGYPLKLNPGAVHAGFVPPKAFGAEKIPPLHESQITAREAICAVLDAAPFEASWVYGHSRGAAYLTIRFYENGAMVLQKPATPEEEAFWSAYAEVEPQP
jgi:hypothetical protein